MLQRFPRGVEHGGFYQKDVDDAPGWVRTVEASKAGGTVRHVVCDDEKTLLYLANQDTITLHGWLARADRLHNPDRLIFDIDPSEDDIGALRDGVHRVKEMLDELGLIAYLQTTGSRGFHIMVPLDGSADFDMVRGFARAAADSLAQRFSGQLTSAARKADRHGRIYLDVMRNAYAQTAVLPYSARAHADAGIATPIRWTELDRAEPRKYTIHSIMRRVSHTTDPWADAANHAQQLPEWPG
jgi:bifunctional non-homologous end joining protein LigD